MNPINNYIIVKAIDNTSRITKQGIVLPEVPDMDETAISQGEVLFSSDSQIKKGDLIIFSKYLPLDFKYKDEIVWAIKKEDIIAIL